ncbi:MAG: hypothetical protein Q9219_001281 [cf. Caloplaca sp. 3 TL-2023]
MPILPQERPNDHENRSTMKLSSSCQAQPQSLHQASCSVPHGAIGARASDELDTLNADLRQQFEELDQNFLADMSREYEEQQHTVDMIKTKHKAERTTERIVEKQLTRGSCTALCKQRLERVTRSKDNLRATLLRMKLKHERTVESLHQRIDELTAEKNNQSDEWNAAQRGYEAKIEKLQNSTESLRRQLDTWTTGDGRRMMHWLHASLRIEHPLKPFCDDFEATMERSQIPDPAEQTKAEVEIEREYHKKMRESAEQSVTRKEKIIFNLKSLCENRERVITYLQASNKVLENQRRSRLVAVKTQRKGIFGSRDEVNSLKAQMLSNGTTIQEHERHQRMDYKRELQRLIAKSTEKQETIEFFQRTPMRWGPWAPASSDRDVIYVRRYRNSKSRPELHLGLLITRFEKRLFYFGIAGRDL